MLFPEMQPAQTGYLEVGDGHRLYWEAFGRPSGLPVVYLHGGPGSGFPASAHRMFDPSVYRVVLFDQRGCGRSRPIGGLQGNDIRNLANDMELIRGHLQIDRWLICGVSWGSLLGLFYAQTYPERVSGLVLRGCFTGRPPELDWLYRPGGASNVFPEAWETFERATDHAGERTLLARYFKMLQEGDSQVREDAARAWCAWEDAISSLQESGQPDVGTAQQWSRALISTHVFLNDPWLTGPRSEDEFDSLQSLPCILVQGRFDMVTPTSAAWRLHRRWPGSEMRVAREAGHSGIDIPLTQCMMTALDDMAVRLRRQA